MANKLFETFKKIPNQIPIFKKTSDKSPKDEYASYNAEFGMTNGITSFSSDSILNIFAFGTQNGIIKLYGFPGVVTLVSNQSKPIIFLEFLEGEGRLLSLNDANELMLWEYINVDSDMKLNWELKMSKILQNETSNKLLGVSISRKLEFKNENNDTIHGLLFFYEPCKICFGVIIGDAIYLHNDDDFIITEEYIRKRTKLDQDIKIENLKNIQFNSNNESILLSFESGLVVIFDFKISKYLESSQENDKTIILKEDELKNGHNSQVEAQSTDEKESKNQAEVEINETEQEVTSENKVDESKDESKAEEPKDGVTSDDSKDETKTDESKSESKTEDKKLNDEIDEEKKLLDHIIIEKMKLERPVFVSSFIKENIHSIIWANDNILIQSTFGEISIYKRNDNEFIMDRSINVSDNQTNLVPRLEHLLINHDEYITFGIKENNCHTIIILKNGEILKKISNESEILGFKYINNSENVSTSNLLIAFQKGISIIDLENLNDFKYPIQNNKQDENILILTEILTIKNSIFKTSRRVENYFENCGIKTRIIEDRLTQILAAGYSNGEIKLWQIVCCGVLNELFSFNIKSLYLDNVEEIVLTKLNLYYEDVDEYGASELFLMVGNNFGLSLIFKFGENDFDNNCQLIKSNINGLSENDGVFQDDYKENCTLKELSDLDLKNLVYIVQLEPNLPITSLFFQYLWNILIIGSTYGFSVLDFNSKSSVFSYSTLQRSVKQDNGAIVPLTVSQQLKKSVRQSFRKLKKFRPNTKHSYNVNNSKQGTEIEKDEQKKQDDKKPVATSESTENKDKTQDSVEINTEPVKVEEAKEDNTESKEIDNQAETDINQEETVVNLASGTKVDTEDKTHDDVIMESELQSVNISRKDKSTCSVRSILLATTNLKSTIKEPSLFIGLNSGSIYGFEMNFDNDNINVKLSKELHLQHKAPVIDIKLKSVKSCTPLLTSKEQIGKIQRTSEIATFKDVANEDETESETKEVGPSGDSSNLKEDAKSKAETLPPAKNSESNRKSVDFANNNETDKQVHSNVKKSGTLPSSFLQAIGKSPSDCHELLVVSEEQIKLFSLPSLKAKFKYKVVDTGHHYSHIKLNSEETQNSNGKCEEAEKNETENIVKKVNRRIFAVGLARVKKLKWVVVPIMNNGEMLQIFLTNLKKYNSNIYNSLNENLIGNVTNGFSTYVVSCGENTNLQITDFNSNFQNFFEPAFSLEIPIWARPIDLTAIKETEKENELEANGFDLVDEERDEVKDQLSNEENISHPTNSVHQGDVTMDSIKEYITNMDGNITVKTFESSTEKHITVDDGKISTTIHEKQVDDGQIVKDDIVKITSDTIAASSEVS